MYVHVFSIPTHYMVEFVVEYSICYNGQLKAIKPNKIQLFYSHAQLGLALQRRLFGTRNSQSTHYISWYYKSKVDIPNHNTLIAKHCILKRKFVANTLHHNPRKKQTSVNIGKKRK